MTDSFVAQGSGAISNLRPRFYKCIVPLFPKSVPLFPRFCVTALNRTPKGPARILSLVLRRQYMSLEKGFCYDTASLNLCKCPARQLDFFLSRFEPASVHTLSVRPGILSSDSSHNPPQHARSFSSPRYGVRGPRWGNHPPEATGCPLVHAHNSVPRKDRETYPYPYLLPSC
jgi:hypothetical protein